MKTIFVFDLDGTLSLVGDRLKYLAVNDWDSFYEACEEDAVNEPIAKIFRHFMFEGYDVRIVSGRRESVREKTLRWLADNNMLIESEKLYLRKNGDKRQDVLVKPELVSSFIHKILYVFEDRSSMVDKWRELGITTLQVAKGDF